MKMYCTSEGLISYYSFCVLCIRTNEKLLIIVYIIFPEILFKCCIMLLLFNIHIGTYYYISMYLNKFKNDKICTHRIVMQNHSHEMLLLPIQYLYISQPSFFIYQLYFTHVIKIEVKKINIFLNFHSPRDFTLQYIVYYYISNGSGSSLS